MTAFSLLGMGVLGYHPYAEDGGLYVAEIKRVLDPALYPSGAEFVAGHLGLGLFPEAVAGVVRVTGLGLPWVLLGLHAICLWGLLYGVWLIAARCYAGMSARVGAVMLVAVWLGLPVAGTSLYLTDAYLTARSVTLALTVLGLGWVLAFADDGRWGWLAGAGAAFGVAALAHPLMAGYGLVEAVLLLVVMKRRVRVWGLAGALLLALAAGWAAQSMAPAETVEYGRVVSSRYYWFLSQWEWFEWVGLAAPLAILGWFSWRGRSEGERGLARMGVAVGGIALVVALCFAREGATVHALARVQPLRCFQMVYLVMALEIGAWLGGFVLRVAVWRWVAMVAVLAGVMVYVQRQTYPAESALEMPWVTPRNGWEQAFLWVREETPKDALFALDADYVQMPGEDAQGFRAIAERSALPDYSKDGGVVSIRPELLEAWERGQAAQARLSEETDGERVAALAGLGVKWVVLRRASVTGFACPYANEVVKVCRLP